MRRILLGGTAVDLCREDEILELVGERLRGGAHRPPLAVASANLDHVHHFGRRGRSAGLLDADGARPEWLVLLDGAPLVRRAAAVTGQPWPALAGSDLLPRVLAVAEDGAAPVGFLGGTPAQRYRLEVVLATRYPALKVPGHWCPQRADLTDDEASRELARDIRAAGVDVLVVGLGKPRQEAWIQRYAPATGARVLLAFGAAADFLAGTAARAPHWVRRAGAEWLYRFAREPRRLARRYWLEGPPAMVRLWTASSPDGPGPSSPGKAG